MQVRKLQYHLCCRNHSFRLKQELAWLINFHLSQQWHQTDNRKSPLALSCHTSQVRRSSSFISSETKSSGADTSASCCCSYLDWAQSFKNRITLKSEEYTCTSTADLNWSWQSTKNQVHLTVSMHVHCDCISWNVILRVWAPVQFRKHVQTEQRGGCRSR